MNEYISKSIYVTRLPLLLGPILIHATMVTDFNLQTYLCLAGTCSVSIFYVISGYLLWGGYSNDFQSFKKKLKSRFKSLLFPYLIWNVIAFLVFVGLGRLEVDQWKEIFWIISTDPGHGPADYALWFVRTLLLIVPFAPFMYMINTNKWLRWISVIALAFWFLEKPGLFSHGTIHGFVLFNFGAFLRLQGVFEKYELKPTKGFSIGCTLVWLILIGVWQYSTVVPENAVPYINKISIAVAAFYYYCLATLLNDKQNDTLKTLGASSFFLFCIFPILLEPIKIIVRDLLGENDAAYLMIVLLVSTIGIALYYLLKKYTPKLCSILSGNR